MTQQANLFLTDYFLKIIDFKLYAYAGPICSILK